MLATEKNTSKKNMPLDDGWLAEMRQAMKAKGLTQAELGRRAGLTRGAINQIFHGHNSNSRFAEQISEVLEIDPPVYVDDPEKEFWIQNGPSLKPILDPDDYQNFKDIVEDIVAHGRSVESSKQALSDLFVAIAKKKQKQQQ